MGDDLTPAQICAEIGHDWVTVYDDDDEIIGKHCTRCDANS